MIKFHGYLGGHYLNIGTTKVTRIIGVWMEQDKLWYQSYLSGIQKGDNVPLFYTHWRNKLKVSSSWKKVTKAIQNGSDMQFDYRQPQYMHLIFPIHICFQVFKVQNLTYFYSISVVSTIPHPCLLSNHVAYFFCPVATPPPLSRLARHITIRNIFTIVKN